MQLNALLMINVIIFDSKVHTRSAAKQKQDIQNFSIF